MIYNCHFERYTQEQHFQIFKFYYQNNRSPIAIFRPPFPFYLRNNSSPVLATARSNENIAAVQSSVAKD